MCNTLQHQVYPEDTSVAPSVATDAKKRSYPARKLLHQPYSAITCIDTGTQETVTFQTFAAG